MKVTKQGIYRDAKGNEFPVFNVCSPELPWFRAYWLGGYYNVNDEGDNPPGGIWEMVEFVRDFKVDKDGNIY